MQVWRRCGAEGEGMGEVLSLWAAEEWASRVLRKPCGPGEVSRARRADTREGRAPDKGGKWAVDRVVEVVRPKVRRGRQLSVRLRWKGSWGEEQTGWIEVTRLNAKVKREARAMEAERHPEERVSGVRRAREDEEREGRRRKTPRLAGVAPVRGLR